MPTRPIIAVSMGDPGGIGPEVVVKALADPARRRRARFWVHGLAGPMHDAAEKAGIEPFWWRAPLGSSLLDTAQTHDVLVLDYEREFPAWRDPVHAGASRAGGEASFRFVEDAIAACRRPAADPLRAAAIVTAPISKEAWALAGHARYPGHTELLAARFGARRHAMMFESPTLRVVLVTAHIPLMTLRDALTIGRVFDAIELGAEGCRRLGVSRPRIAVCGLNPHAGEAGLLGEEEGRVVTPAIELARRTGLEVSGPHPADTLFKAAAEGRYDLVVAMYHDQGLIPVKLLHFDRAVNVTVGLPVPRTSPDHGTAFDIAGKNKADAGSMGAALGLAVKMS